MPHNQLKLQGGVIVNETPVINQTGIASSNRIRFKPDPQGLSLVEKLGGWAKFWATQITNGVVRALHGWQETDNDQWLAFATDNPTGAVLGAVQCSVSAGITTATGTLQNLTPPVFTSNSPVSIIATGGSNQFTLIDNFVASAKYASVYITTPISVGGVVLFGSYAIVSSSSPNFVIQAVDVLGNPLLALYSNYTTNQAVSNVVFAAGTPNTLTFTLPSALPSALPVGQSVNVYDSNNTISGTYIVLSSTTTTFAVATSLLSYTYSPTITWTTGGSAPLFATTSGSATVTVTFANHGYTVGNSFYVLNPTLVGGLLLSGTYTVATVPNTYTFTFVAQSAAAATSTQYQGAVAVTGGSSSGTAVTLDFSTTIFNYPFTIPPLLINETTLVQGVNPSGWNGWYTLSSGTSSSVTYPKTIAAGSWVSGGSFSLLGGMLGLIYTTGSGTSSTTPGGFWTLSNWGNYLIAVSANTPVVNYPSTPVLYQPIWYWDPNTLPPAQLVTNGPVANNGAFVAMPQRQIVAWGSTFSGIIDPLLIRWCDVNNFNVWAAQITNQAGSFRLPSGAAIIGARQLPQQGLIWTDIELWAMQYIGPPLVYGFNKIGSGCGLIGKYAHGVLGGVTYWMGKSQLFMLTGNGVQPLPCPVWDVAFQDLDLSNVSKILCATNALFQEVAWYFPVKGGNGENSQYIKYNAQVGVWDYGTLDRSAWVDVSVLQQPIGFSPLNKYIYQHEISPDADGAAMGETFTTGWFALAEGDVMPYVDQFWPDFKWGYFGQTQNANVTMSFASQAYPGAAQYSYGPYTVSQSTSYISPRIRNRLVNFTVAGTGTGNWWRLGGIRYRVQADGKF